MSDNLRPCWWNCYSPDDKRFLDDKELLAIDAMEDSIAPLDDNTVRIRQLITRFELCYHEADKEAELIAKAIGSGQLPEESHTRPPQRRRELQNSHDILSAWCQGDSAKCTNLNVGGISADELLSFIGKQSPLKIWQVKRVVDRISQALDTNYTYHWLTIDPVDHSEPGAYPAGKYYEDDSAFLKQTKQTIILDTVDGRKSKVSLAMAIDLLMPCHWDFVGVLVIILKAIGGDLHPARPLTCCSRNIKLSPLCDRMKIISNTLGAFWKDKKTAKKIDRDILISLEQATPVKCWLAASLDKTIRLHLSLPFEVDLF